MRTRPSIMILAVTIICIFFSRAGGQYKDGLLLDPATIIASIFAGNMDVVRYLIAAGFFPVEMNGKTELVVVIGDEEIALCGDSVASVWGYECDSVSCRVHQKGEAGLMPVEYAVEQFFRSLDGAQLNRIDNERARIAIGGCNRSYGRIKRDIIEALKVKRYGTFKTTGIPDSLGCGE